MNDFLNSKSMLTPGAAGALTTLFTATLSTQFHLSAKWTALSISAILGLTIVLADTQLSRLLKMAFFIINSLIIFSVAVGANTAAAAASAPAKPVIYESEPRSRPQHFFHNWFQE